MKSYSTMIWAHELFAKQARRIQPRAQIEKKLGLQICMGPNN